MSLVKYKEKRTFDKTPESKASEPDIAHLLKKAPRQKQPTSFSPMLATLTDAPFDDPGWEYEVKWDGYRAVAFMHKNEVELKSRNDKSFNEKFYPVYEALKNWNINAIVDGEVVVTMKNGISSFGALQNWRSEADGNLYYYVFDIVWLDGKDLTGLPLFERKTILKSVLPAEGIIRSGYSVQADGTAFFGAARDLGIEGIIAKKSDSLYLPGERSREWLKIKVNKRQEVVIAGYTRNEGSPKYFSSLLLGVYEGGQLKYVGKVGTGFKDKQQREMIQLFKPLVIQKSPFEEEPDYNKPSRFRPDPPHAKATWLKPSLVCEVSFTEVTADGVFRHPSFEGMREDKSAMEVVRETAKPVKKS